MSILKLRTNLVKKIKYFGNNFYPVLTKPIKELYLPMKSASLSLSRVLSIDDSQICQKINVNHLRKLGCSVECVHSARSALDKLLISYKVIFLDANLPDCSTEVLINLIRSDEKNVNQMVPIVLTSSWIKDSLKKNYLALGAHEVYIKPIKEMDFKKILQNYGVIA